MRRPSSTSTASFARAARRLARLACMLAACGLAAASAAAATSRASAAKASATVALEQCVTAVDQVERSATFAGEMTAITGSARMEMRIDLLERTPQELAFHTVIAPGLGVWRFAAPGVKVYRYLKQVTNLSAPAFYKAAVRFRWLNSKGKLMKALELRTPRCQQPAPPATAVTATGTTLSPAG